MRRDSASSTPSCEAYTASTPYAVWRELLREFMDFGRDDPDAAIVERLRAARWRRSAPDLAPWLPLIAIAFDLEIAPTPEVEMLAENEPPARSCTKSSAGSSRS